jgi:hypothetical protein
MLIGDSYSKRLPVQRLRDSFGWIILTMALGILVTEFVL